MRLAYLCNLYPAVSHSFVRREIEGVEAAGHQVHRFSLRPAEANLADPADLRELPLTEAVLAQGVLRLTAAWLSLALRSPGRSFSALRAAHRMSGPGVKSKIRHLAYLLEAAWLTRRLNHLQIDHLHAHFGTNPAAVALLARELGGPSFSFTVHGPDEFDAPLALGIRQKIGAAAIIAAISSYGRSQLMRWSSPDEWGKIVVVRCGLDQSFLEAERTEVPASSKEFVCVARLSAQKGLPVLIAACDRLRTDGETFTVTIIGDGEMRSEIANEIRRRGLEGFIKLVGIRSAAEIREHLMQARAFVLPSFAEGLPVVLMEALALGRPVITTAIAGIPELVDADCGWLVPAGSEEALVGAMKEALAASPDELSRKGQNGRARVQKMHNAKMNARQLLDYIGASKKDETARPSS